jgi:hypothetical protein
VLDAALARELGEIAWAVLLFPWRATVVGNRAGQSVHPEPAEATRLHCAPVVLVHGYGGSPAAWSPLEGELRRAGFTNVHAAAYNAMTTRLDDIARRLVTQCHEAMEIAETDHLRSGAVNVAVPNVGHLGVLRAPVFLGSVVRQLLAAEEEAGVSVAEVVAAGPSVVIVA